MANIYVRSTDGNDADNGSTWALAKATIVGAGVIGDLTRDQARVSFNTAYGRSLNTAQWNTLVTTRFLPARDRYQAMLDEAAL